MKILIDEATVELVINLLDRQWQCSALYSLEESQELADALRQAIEQAEKQRYVNQCGETCERAKLCATCARDIYPEQEREPVATVITEDKYAIGEQTIAVDSPLEVGALLYTSPPQHQPLQEK